MDALQPVFLVGAGLTGAAFLLSLLLKEKPLRATTGRSAAAAEDPVIAPAGVHAIAAPLPAKPLAQR